MPNWYIKIIRKALKVSKFLTNITETDTRITVFFSNDWLNNEFFFTGVSDQIATVIFLCIINGSWPFYESRKNIFLNLLLLDISLFLTLYKITKKYIRIFSFNCFSGDVRFWDKCELHLTASLIFEATKWTKKCYF